MSLDPNKPTFRFFKLHFPQAVCPACQEFDNRIFQNLIQDKDIRKLVNIEKIDFGFTKEGKRLDLSFDYPDFNVTYGPYVVLSKPYDEKTGYHLNKETMNNPKLNKRQDFVEYSFQGNSTYDNLRNWILENIDQDNITSRSVMLNNRLFRKSK